MVYQGIISINQLELPPNHLNAIDLVATLKDTENSKSTFNQTREITLKAERYPKSKRRFSDIITIKYKIGIETLEGKITIACSCKIVPMP